MANLFNSGINPPSRTCVEFVLPRNRHVQIDALCSRTYANELPPKHMHVQSVSHWAPANIGPYSQAVQVSFSFASHDFTKSNLVLIHLLPFSTRKPFGLLEVRRLCMVLYTCFVNNISFQNLLYSIYHHVIFLSIVVDCPFLFACFVVCFTSTTVTTLLPSR